MAIGIPPVNKVRFMGLLLLYPMAVNKINSPSGIRKGAEVMKDYDIVWVRGHVEVYDWAGRFCFSADNEREALAELEMEVAA